MKKIRRQCRYVVMKPPSSGPTAGPSIAGHAQVIHRADELRAAHRAEDDDAPDRHHHRAADALHEAREREGRKRIGGRAEQRANDEDADRGAKDGARAEAVGDPAADRDEDAEAEHVARDGDLQRDGVSSERAGHRGNGRHDDIRIHAFHEHRARDDERGNESFDGERHGESRDVSSRRERRLWHRYGAAAEGWTHALRAHRRYCAAHRHEAST